MPKSKSKKKPALKPEAKLIDCECQCCFLCFEAEKKQTYCEYCEERREWIMKQSNARFSRILEIMPKTRACRLPEILRILWEL